MNVDYSAYEGCELQGWTELVISRGRVVIDKGNESETHKGEFIKRVGCGELLR
jgi:dihydropyrimidinase